MCRHTRVGWPRTGGHFWSLPGRFLVAPTKEPFKRAEGRGRVGSVVPSFSEFMVDAPVFSRSFAQGAEEGLLQSPSSLRPEAGSSEAGGSEAVRVLLVGCGSELQSNLRHRLLSPHWRLREAGGGVAALHLLEQEASDLVLVAPVLPDLHAGEFQQLVKARFPGVQVFSLESFVQPAGSELQPAGSELQPAGRELSVAGNARTASPAALQGGLPSVMPGRFSAGDGAAVALRNWQGIVGASPAMERVFRMAALVSRRDTTVLIGGESGTGKDLLARAIHNAGPRARQPFVVINCAAIPETLLEAELFGYTKGSFTGASQSRTGRVHAAHGGTLFLDEIGDMPLSLQSKILRFLEQGEVQRIGSTDTLKVDCRIVAATNADLPEQVKARQFREDLYYRLAVMPIAVPPLRERMNDLPALCAGFLERFCPGTVLGEEALALLEGHRWPGNVRELRNVMERASLFAEGRPAILPEDIVL